MNSTPLGESMLIDIGGQLLNLSEVGPNKLNINFDEIGQNLRHEVVDYELKKINYKTVETSLKGQYPQILSASLMKNSDELFILTITVNYEFLPEIREEIIFSKRELKPEETEEASSRNMRNYLKNLKEQVNEMRNIQVSTGQIESIGGKSETYVKLNYEESLLTWTIILDKPSGTVFKPQLHYYNSATKKSESSGDIPNEGLYMYHNGEEFSTDLRFVVNQSATYDSALLILEGNLKGRYILTIEKITS